MSALRIFRTASPSAIGGPIQPMSREDADFWRLRRLHSPAASSANPPRADAPSAPALEAGPGKDSAS